MKNITITLEESVPHYDNNWVKMQMINFRFGITATKDDDETIEDFKNLLQNEFEKQREHIANTSPTLEKRNKKINFILDEIKKTNPTLLKEIIKKANTLIT